MNTGCKVLNRSAIWLPHLKLVFKNTAGSLSQTTTVTFRLSSGRKLACETNIQSHIQPKNIKKNTLNDTWGVWYLNPIQNLMACFYLPLTDFRDDTLSISSMLKAYNMRRAFSHWLLVNSISLLHEVQSALSFITWGVSFSRQLFLKLLIVLTGIPLIWILQGNFFWLSRSHLWNMRGSS